MHITKCTLFKFLVLCHLLAKKELTSDVNTELANLRKKIDKEVNEFGLNTTNIIVLDNVCELTENKTKHLVHSFIQAYFADRKFMHFLIFSDFTQDQYICILVQKTAVQMLTNKNLNLYKNSVAGDNEAGLELTSQASLMKYIQDINDIKREYCPQLPDSNFPNILEITFSSEVKCEKCKYENNNKDLASIFYTTDIDKLQRGLQDREHSEKEHIDMFYSYCEICGNREDNFVFVSVKYPTAFIVSHDPIGEIIDDLDNGDLQEVSQDDMDETLENVRLKQAPETLELQCSEYDMYAKLRFTRNSKGVIISSYTVAKNGSEWYNFKTKKYEESKLANSQVMNEDNQNDREVENPQIIDEEVIDYNGCLYFYRKRID